MGFEGGRAHICTLTCPNVPEDDSIVHLKAVKKLGQEIPAG